MRPTARRRVTSIVFALAISRVLLVFLSFGLGTAMASPANDKAKAKSLYESATTHYNLGELNEALGDFKEAYRLVHDPALLFNIAQCLKRLGQFQQAADFFRAFRREFPDAPNRLEIERMIEEMDRQAAAARTREAVSSPPAPSPQPMRVPETQPAKTTIVAAAPPIHQRQTPVHKRWWVWTLAIAASAGVAVGLGVGFGVHRTTGTTFSPEMVP